MSQNYFGERIRELRKAKGLTLTELGDLAGCSNPYLSQIETGYRNAPASPEFLTKLSGALGVSKIYLYRIAGLLEETDILELVDENKRLREALQNACNSLGADIEDYL
ncbi:transcriptional regulator [Sporosarcina sp. NCCP-2716]|uniref:helix-turn-helix domain-containing protein n=1 Tax=Sporosarcina sp. NCCP-2716 TaxID=2943679 RepID=UPI00203D6E54|nr:helix-turn-helix transcriptional regulator [Sporosarcina sp. NCCP-2716]GKV69824.1 transcriptional regulator [Sporosarcina sp. NCCP-2716]